jgi:hypothetical protein
MQQEKDSLTSELDKLSEQIEGDELYSDAKSTYDELIAEGVLSRPQYDLPLTITL